MKRSTWKKEQLAEIRIRAKIFMRGKLDFPVRNPHAKNTAEYRAFEKGVNDAYTEAGL